MCPAYALSQMIFGASPLAGEGGHVVFKDRAIVIPVIFMYNNLYDIDGLLNPNHGERSGDADSHP